MARGISTLLTSTAPRALAPARVTIGHVQLRDVVICPHDKGLVTYPHNYSIVEHDIHAPNSTPRTLADLDFIPNSVSALPIPGTDDTILAAGGQEAELHLSVFTSTSSGYTSAGAPRRPARGFGKKQWENKFTIEPGSINNSVSLTSMNLTQSNESSVEPRLVVSNNDHTVKFFDIGMRRNKTNAPRLHDGGQLRMDVAVNHSSISPDGRTLLCVGDSPDVFLYRIAGGAHLRFDPIAKLSLSPYIANSPFYYTPSALSINSVPASFSTAFSADGSKFVVGSQEGAVVVWDVRSTKPLKVIQTNKSRGLDRIATGEASGYLYDQPWDWTRGAGNAPGWGVRSVKFSPPGVGREVLTFTEHSNLVHVIDAQTFEKEEIIRMPTPATRPVLETMPIRPRSSSPSIPPPVNFSPPSIRSSPPPRIVLFSGALEDTFRIPSTSETNARRRAIGRRLRGREEANPDDDVDGIVVIPPLGDPQVEDDVRRLLNQQGLRTRSAVLDRGEVRDTAMSERERDPPEDDDAMDVDEPESDCFSSHTPSRAPSPALPQSPPVPSRSSDHLRVSRPGLLARRESSGPYSVRRLSSRRKKRAERVEPDVDVDLAGTCFDPTGSSIYVASVKGVAEWTVRGAEQRWWTDPQWA
ncbi:WD40-repeat-containing domain protein [Fomitopsis serialis]|uniref:WD40-repeat-containing domain protein n=1 Tax=Fomitopsis serialis TaxID=139415 RepID=UPI002007B428|nr:WD40-repeat-containing domain protein [Neoantrodia serialis]KAH9928400.1 WD40-repeat-containing domain protein [Neoantrodia serialis]